MRWWASVSFPLFVGACDSCEQPQREAGRNNPKLSPIFLSALKHAAADIRAAGAYGLGSYDTSEGDTALTALLKQVCDFWRVR